MFIAGTRARKPKARRAVAVLSVVASVVPHLLVVPRDGPVELLPGQAGGLDHVLDAVPRRSVPAPRKRPPAQARPHQATLAQQLYDARERTAADRRFAVPRIIMYALSHRNAFVYLLLILLLVPTWLCSP